MPNTLYLEIGSQFETAYGTAMSQLFGKPCLKTNGKAFAAFFQDQMVFKLGKEQLAEYQLIYTGSINWDPSGKKRRMKGWLQVPYDYKDDWEQLALEAKSFVETTS
ncbi:MAG: hypothetical protein P8H59_01375 [Flavobacteriales bacterium]|nr:hypothetical protein [Flavobacteriales bacterium]MDG2245700.1 hypothetical protein [Flavobacteriales bacterium]